jgi:hypothetical protein
MLKFVRMAGAEKTILTNIRRKSALKFPWRTTSGIEESREYVVCEKKGGRNG